MNNDSPPTLLYDVRQNGKCRWKTSVSVREHINGGAISPADIGRGVNSRLDVWSIEVKGRHLDLRERATERQRGLRHIASMHVELTGNQEHPTG